MNSMLINESKGLFLDQHRLLYRCLLLFSMVNQVPINSPYETFSSVAKELFADGIYNWGRIVTLFYFTYKLVLKVTKDDTNND